MRCFVVCKMINKLPVEHSASIVIILAIVFFIFYYCASEVYTERSFDSKLHLYENVDQSQDIVDNDLAKITTYDVKLRRIVGGKCDQLYEVARDMLAGEKAPLPYETKKTRWKFHPPGDLDALMKKSLRWNNMYWSDSTPIEQHFSHYSDVKARNIKVKKYFITFANNCCSKSKLKAVDCARDPGGFDFTAIHDMNSLSKGFQHTHSDILRQKRGSGFWLWKPYIVLKTLVENMADDDLLMYQDAGAYLLEDAGPLLKLCQDSETGILVFHTDFSENHFSKRDAFVLMDMDDSRIYKTFQRLASFLVIRRNCKSLQFVMEWLAYACDPRILTDMKNQMGKANLPEFADHRHDQSVLSLLSKKWELNELRDPSQYGNVQNMSDSAVGPYKQIIEHTRDTSLERQN